MDDTLNTILQSGEASIPGAIVAIALVVLKLIPLLRSSSHMRDEILALNRENESLRMLLRKINKGEDDDSRK